MHPIESVKARTKTFMVRHYYLTPFYFDFKNYRNIHQGDSCFVLGNGPSLNSRDLTELHNKGIICFAANRIYKIFNQTLWRPTYYVCTDHVLIRDFLHEADSIPAKRKFTSLHNHYHCDITLNNCTYFNYIYPKSEATFDTSKFDFHVDGSKAMYWAGTVTNCMIQIAFHMGFKIIYLIGVDHNFDNYIDESGNVVTDSTVKNYFCENYDTDVIDEVRHNLGNSTKGYRKIAEFARNNEINIYNASRQTKLQEFPMIGFEEAVDSIMKGRKNNV